MRVAVLDCETTGIDPKNDHLVTLFVGVMEDSGVFSSSFSWMFNPGIEIPQTASDVHKITTERAKNEGVQPENHEDTLRLIRNFINSLVVAQKLPLAIYNAPFDTTMLNTEFARNNVEVLDWEFNVVDPFVIDKQVDPWRKGQRKLTVVAEHYGIPVDEEKAHDAAYDCYLTGRVAQKLLAHKDIAPMNAYELFKAQQAWKQTQAEGLQKYLRSQNNDDSIVVNPSWPVQH